MKLFIFLPENPHETNDRETSKKGERKLRPQYDGRLPSLVGFIFTQNDEMKIPLSLSVIHVMSCRVFYDLWKYFPVFQVKFSGIQSVIFLCVYDVFLSIFILYSTEKIPIFMRLYFHFYLIPSMMPICYVCRQRYVSREWHEKGIIFPIISIRTTVVYARLNLASVVLSLNRLSLPQIRTGTHKNIFLVSLWGVYSFEYVNFCTTRWIWCLRWSISAI